MLVCGVDEAGRGPVFGPLVICGFVIDASQRQRLRELGVDDSKRLSPRRRNKLVPVLRELGRVVVRLLSPDMIYSALQSGTNLNQLEYLAIAEILHDVAPITSAVLDTVGIPATMVQALRKLEPRLSAVRIIAMKGADAKDPIVGAASIIAKVMRDEAMEMLALRPEVRLIANEQAALAGQRGEDKLVESWRQNPLGSGYPSDPRTKALLAAYFARHGDVPEFARKSWKTVKRLFEKPGHGKTRQSKLV